MNSNFGLSERVRWDGGVEIGDADSPVARTMTKKYQWESDQDRAPGRNTEEGEKNGRSCRRYKIGHRNEWTNVGRPDTKGGGDKREIGHLKF